MNASLTSKAGFYLWGSLLTGWTLWVGFHGDSTTIVTLDVAQIARVAAQELADSESLQDSDKEAVVSRVRSVVQSYAKQHSLIVLDRSVVMAGLVKDITPTIIEAIQP